MFRSRVALAIIGIIVIGGASAAVALLGANTGSLVNSTPAAATATAAASALADSTSTPTSPAPTAATPGAAPTHASSSGEIIDLHGTISDIGSMQFTLRDGSGTIWTVQVTSSTTYEGASQTFDGLQAGMSAEVKGVIIGDATFHAYHVHAESQA